MARCDQELFIERCNLADTINNQLSFTVANEQTCNIILLNNQQLFKRNFLNIFWKLDAITFSCLVLLKKKIKKSTPS